ncbi:hypothetical protein EV702DRAFT_1202904 [Suillus placidus]|uniref:Uncharacterized protein n=1 Tax=Suillus placidus TaxID=48579 RepID=A0A9P6ZLQ0_9AGAM|nr:hypothetical protein EV702DRAFT_1202904 [Suillus placidus]
MQKPEKEMLLNIMGHLIALDKRKARDDARELISSAEFKQSLTDRLRACLLSPNLSGYVTHLSQNLFEFVKKHPSVFKIPLAALQDLELMNKLDSMIKELLTQQRGSMKQKIVTSADRGSNIHALCRSLSGNCTEITSAHWSRRSSLIQFRTVVAESAKSQEEVTLNSNHEHVPADMEGDEADSSPSTITQCTWTFNQYWSYIDVLLGELRDDAKKNTSTTQAAEEFVKQFFTEVLQADLRKYPSTTSLAPSLDSVTVDWQKTIHSKLIW